MKKINAYCLKALGNKENFCKNVKRIFSFLRFFEILQNLDSEIDCMTLEGTISLLISRFFRKGNVAFFRQLCVWRLFDLRYFLLPIIQSPASSGK